MFLPAWRYLLRYPSLGIPFTGCSLFDAVRWAFTTTLPFRAIQGTVGVVLPFWAFPNCWAISAILPTEQAFCCCRILTVEKLPQLPRQPRLDY